MLRLSDNPAILTPEVQSVTELSGTWWVAHTKARFEKVFAWDMFNRRRGYFLPMREKIIFSGGRKRHIMAPLFTSYVFICGTELDRYTALTTNRLCQTIDVVDQDGLIKERASVEKALLSKAIIDHYPQSSRRQTLQNYLQPYDGYRRCGYRKKRGKGAYGP